MKLKLIVVVQDLSEFILSDDPHKHTDKVKESISHILTGQFFSFLTSDEHYSWLAWNLILSA